MTSNEQPTELQPALLYETLPKPGPYPFDKEPAPAAKSRPPHRFEVKARIPFYPGAVYQAPTPGYPPASLGAPHKPARQEHRPARYVRRPQSEPRPPATSAIHRTGNLADLTGPQIRDMLIHAATPPEPVSLLNPTGEFARQVDAVARARQAEEAVPTQHLPKRRFAFRLRRFLPVLLPIASCRHCGQAWPCHRLRRHLTARHGKNIDLPILRLSTKRRRKRADRRSPTAITHRPKPRRIDKQERRLGLR